MAPQQRSAREQPNTELYGLLHLSRDASDDDIKRAFRHWAQVYHPDKFQLEQMREMATSKFREIREAYNVLSDPHKRQVYDIYGTEGLKSGMEIGERLKTREEIRDEFERMQAQKEERRKASRIQHSSSILVNVALEEVARERLARRGERDSGYVEVTGQTANTTVQLPVSKKNVVVLGGTVVSKNGAGVGATMLALKHACSSFSSWETLVVMGIQNMITAQATRQLSSHASGTLGVTYHPREGTISLSETWTRQITDKTSGTVAITVGDGLSTDVSWQRRGEKVDVSGDIKAGPGMFGFSAQCSRRVSALSSLRASAKFGSHGVEVELTATRRMSSNSTAGFSCAVGLQGLFWKLRYTRGGFKIAVPILLTRELQLSKVAMATLVPPAIYMLLKVYVLKPRSLQRRKRKALEKRKQTAIQVREALEAARTAQELLETVSRRNRQRQEARDGLLVEKAVYGALGKDGRPRRYEDGQGSGGEGGSTSMGEESREAGEEAAASGTAEGDAAAAAGVSSSSLPSDDTSERRREDHGLPPSFLDVSIPLQFLVEEDSKLILHENIGKAGLMGFCDPCPGEEKRLSIEYSFKGVRHRVIVGDFEGIVLPQDKHRVVG